MKSEPYKRKPGDFEIRILNDGKVVMIAPDETLIEVAHAVEPSKNIMPSKKGDKKECRKSNQRNRVKN